MKAPVFTSEFQSPFGSQGSFGSFDQKSDFPSFFNQPGGGFGNTGFSEPPK